MESLSLDTDTEVYNIVGTDCRTVYFELQIFLSIVYVTFFIFAKNFRQHELLWK